MESGDWLDAPPARTDQQLNLPAVIVLPDDYRSRVAIAEACWSRLSIKQKTFLGAWRDCRYNARAAERMTGISRRIHSDSQHEDDYQTVIRVWQANAAANALDRDRLLARQDDIVETLLTPKPVLHQGVPVYHEGKVLEEVEAAGASRANEVLLQAAGVIKSGKDTEVNVNVGIVGPALNIQVMPMPPSKSAEERAVPIDIPEPAIDAEFEEVNEDWLSGV